MKRILHMASSVVIGTAIVVACCVFFILVGIAFPFAALFDVIIDTRRLIIKKLSRKDVANVEGSPRGDIGSRVSCSGAHE